ncbi:MAG: alpha-hydroxy-acid oxidizing protein [Acetatifactor sp.]|nr:alpha-hydroxy-acid oxidizing protein [Acetatifactor sp.]
MSNPKSDSIQISRQFLDSLVVEGRIIGSEHPTSKVTVLGMDFETPIMTGALSHLKRGMAGLAEGAKMAGAICSVGMGDNDSLGEVLATGAKVIKIIKPYADKDDIFSRISFSETHGAIGVGMDVEHAVNTDNDADSIVAGERMKLPTLQELKEYIKNTKLPFFIKGALSVQDALRAKELGCAGIIMSHHNGLMRWATPPYMLLPEIRKAVGDDFLLIADGGIQDGFDAFKALALGADLVCVGRALMPAYDENGPKGVAQVINQMNDELKAMMVRTCSPDPKHIDSSVIHYAPWLK